MNINLDASLLVDTDDDDGFDDSPVAYPSIYASQHSHINSQSFLLRDSQSIVQRNRSMKESALKTAPSLLREYLNDRLETELALKARERRIFYANLMGTFLPVLLCIGLFCFNNQLDPDNPKVGKCMGVIVLISGWWMAAPIPTIAVSLSPVFLFPLTDILSGSQTAKSYFTYVQMLLIGAFLVDICIEESRLAERFGLRGLLLFAESSNDTRGLVRPSRMVFGFMAIAYILSLFIANTSVTMMMMPFCISLLDKIEEANQDQKQDCHRFTVATLLGVSFAANCGGLATSIGTTANLVLTNDMTELYGQNHSPSFAKFFLLCWVPSLAMFFAAYIVIYICWCRHLHSLRVPTRLAQEALDKLGPIDRDQCIVLLAQLSQMVLWFGRSIYYGYGWREFDDGTVSILCAFPLFFISSSQRPGQAILTKDMVAHLDWDLLMLVGAGFAIAAAVSSSKLDNYVAAAIGTGDSTSVPLFLVVFVAFSSVAILTEFASSNATANVLIPILAVTAVHSNLHPFALMLPACLACSCAFSFPVATPSNAIVFSTGRFTLKEMVHTGFWLTTASMFIVPFCMLFYTFPVGGIGSFKHAHLPDWANDKTPSPTPFS